MNIEQVVPETKGVTVKLLETIDLGPEIEGMAGRQFRMRMVTFEPEVFMARFTTIKTGRALSTYYRERSQTFEMESLPIMGRDWAGLKIGTPCTGSRTEEQLRRWRSRSILSGKSKPVRGVIKHLIHLSPNPQLS